MMPLNAIELVADEHLDKALRTVWPSRYGSASSASANSTTSNAPSGCTSVCSSSLGMDILIFQECLTPLATWKTSVMSASGISTTSTTPFGTPACNRTHCRWSSQCTVPAEQPCKVVPV